ncbi:MAG TPA: UDP-3-O-(3-hydroxymyristoyl)glucosamine N-acyltransferase [Bacteroidia bacterium]|jgi:UDP-3-O-[3-hydroxymyristoyl] glucosamine N-acyltransferase|nr:UDP-3-O-(3-hydroxymyristoyl)glucosamine N-acyltransferase [Bacteroidia bacterium]
MKINPPQTLEQIASIIGAEFDGNPGHLITGLNEIHRVEKGDIVFVDHPKYYDKALQSNATTIIINKKVTCPDGKALLFSDDPFSAYNKIIRHFHPDDFSQKLMVNPSAKIGKNTIIMPGVFIGNNVVIGDDCVIHPNVAIYDETIIGNRVTIHSGTVLGADAFYYKKRTPDPKLGNKGYFDKMLSCGIVVIEDDVDLGAMCTIDRGVSEQTIIGAGSKLDNHVHVGHDTRIGKMCLIAAQVGIAGCVTLEDGVTLWGQVGIPSNIHIGKGAVLLGQSAPSKSLEGGKSYLGSPAGEAKDKMRELITLKQITEEREGQTTE